MRCIARRGTFGALAVVFWNYSRPASLAVSAFGLSTGRVNRNGNSSIRSAGHSSRRPLSLGSLASSGMETEPSVKSPPLKVLALHGSGGTAEEFPGRLVALNEALAFYSSGGDDKKKTPLELEITTVQAPFVKEDGFSWWTMPPGVRSFNAEEYTGFEESAKRVLDVWETGGFDIVLGHSQGAILVGALLAMERTPYHPPGGYIMNGVSFPNPYSAELESLERTNTVENNNDGSPEVLFLLGKRDKIAPNATGEKLRDLLGQGGFRVSSCYHEGGHSFPQEDVGDEAMRTIVQWILQGRE